MKKILMVKKKRSTVSKGSILICYLRYNVHILLSLQKTYHTSDSKSEEQPLPLFTFPVFHYELQDLTCINSVFSLSKSLLCFLYLISLPTMSITNSSIL